MLPLLPYTMPPSSLETGFVHAFPAVRGVQAGRTFYIAMCPLRIIPKMFVFNEEEVPAELRAQRTINRSRIPEIAKYLLKNQDSYVLSALTASVDSQVSFVPSVATGAMAALGVLNIPMEAQILINDGQHRRAAIEEAVKHSQILGHDNVPVLFFIDEGLARSQQMFADLNKHAVRPSTSLGTLYDQRDETARLARYLATECDTFVGLTEMEKSGISNRSTKLFALSSIKLATRVLLSLGKNDGVSAEQQAKAKAYWEEVAKNIPEWQMARRRTVAPSSLREQTVHAHGLALHALGIVGAQLFKDAPNSWKKSLVKLKLIDWSRNNSRLWEGRALMQGRMSKANASVSATAAVIKKELGLSLSAEDKLLLSRKK